MGDNNMKKDLTETLRDEEKLLAGLISHGTSSYILRILTSGYGKLGINKEIAGRFIEILTLNYDKPKNFIEKEIRSDSMLNDMFRYPDGKFHKAYKEYRKTGRYGWLESLTGASIFRGVICDVGCGNNALGEYLLTKEKDIKKVIGVDISRYQDIRENPPYLEFQEAVNPPELPIESGSADIATVIYTLHHVPCEEQIDLLKEIYRVLKDKGLVVIIEDTYAEKIPVETDPDGLVKDFLNLSLNEQMLVLKFSDWLANSSIIYPDVTSEVPVPGVFRSMESWKKIFKEAGFKVLETRFVGLPEERIHMVPMGYFLLQKTD